MNRWLRRWVAASAATALLLPGIAQAQQAGGDTGWEDAPAEGEAQADPGAAVTNSQQAAPAQQAAPSAGQQYDDRDPRALTDFAAELEPYGYWRDDPTYGRVWVPNANAVGPDFAPYVTSGHWAQAPDNQWMWVSDYPFGWVVFHYGRWVWITGTGWAWIPGRQYAPAWVVWRTPEAGWDYVGWAPMPPDYLWWDGVAVGLWFGVYTPWVFCPSGYMYYPYVHRYIVRDHYYVQQIAAHSHRYYAGSTRPGYAGPSASQGHIPAKAVPKQHTPADPKAIAASRKSGSSASAQVIHPGGRASDGSGTRRVSSSNWGGLHSGSRTLSTSNSRSLASRSYSFPHTGARTAGGYSYGGPRPLTTSRTLSGSSYEPFRSARGSSPSYSSGPTYRSSSSFGSSPTYRSGGYSPPVYRSAPSYSSGGFGGGYRASPSFGGGSSFRSAPSYHYSAPSGGFRSAPSFHPSSSSHSFGGGGGGRHR